MGKQNIDKKRIIKYLIIIVVVIIATIIIHSKLVYITPEFQGKIIDETTGKPIEKAIITVRWKEYKMAFDNPNRPFDGLTIITDKEGKYIIPRHRSLHLITEFTSMIIDVSHPLYARESEYGGWAIFSWDNDRKTESYEGTKLPNGSIHYDIKLVGVEEKYKNDYDKLNDIPRPYSLVNFINSQNSQYLMDLKRQYSLRYDLDFIMKRWEEIGTKIYKEKAKESWFQDVINKFKKEFKELKQEGY